MPKFEDQVAAGFKAAGERMNTMDMSVEECKATIVQLQKQLRTVYAQVADGTKATGQYPGFWPSEEHAKAFGDLILCIAGKKAMDTGGATGGSAVVPDELASWLIWQTGKFGKFRRDALVVPMGSGKLLVPEVTADLTVYCPGEGGTITPSDLAVGQVELLAKTVAALCVASLELEEDSIVALGEIIGLSASRSMAKKEDQIGFCGDGTSTYFGMRGVVGALRAVDEPIANIKGLKVASGNTYAEITLADLKGVVALLPEEADENAKWYMNRKFYFNVIWPLAEAAGVANIFEILSDKKGHNLLGYPVEFVSAMPSTEANSQICALLGDLKIGAYLGERRALTLERSEHVLFANSQIAFRAIERIDIDAYGVGDTTDAGPLVGLITAAA